MNLEVEASVAQSQPLNKDLHFVFLQSLFNHGLLPHYMDMKMGSSWYVEVPRFLNELYEEVGIVAVKDTLEILLSEAPSSEYVWSLIEGSPLFLE